MDSRPAELASAGNFLEIKILSNYGRLTCVWFSGGGTQQFVSEQAFQVILMPAQI